MSEGAPAAARAIEFFFDIASTYSYLASTQVDALSERLGVPVRWRPFLLGGVIKATGNRTPIEIPAKARYMLMDLQDWAALYGIPLRFPSHFPPNSLPIMRVLSAVAEEDVRVLAHALFTAYWCDQQDLSDLGVLAQAIDRAGFPSIELLARAQDQDVKDALRRTTDEAVMRGAFGAPTFFFAGRMFWGNDRLVILERFVRATLDADANAQLDGAADAKAQLDGAADARAQLDGAADAKAQPDGKTDADAKAQAEGA